MRDEGDTCSLRSSSSSCWACTMASKSMVTEESALMALSRDSASAAVLSSPLTCRMSEVNCEISPDTFGGIDKDAVVVKAFED